MVQANARKMGQTKPWEGKVKCSFISTLLTSTLKMDSKFIQNAHIKPEDYIKITQKTTI
jgi:hypothetical protein